MDKVSEYLQIAIDHAVFFLPKIALAVLIFWIGFKLVKRLLSVIQLGLEKGGISDTLRPFVLSLVNFLLKGAVLFIIATVIGADLTGLVAILAAAGFAVGMALQGSLGNFASGILILSLRPYKVGDWIQVQERFGRVEEIELFSTNIVTPGNKTLIIPNAQITDSIVTNFSKKSMIRLELEVSMPYNESFPKVRQIIQEALLTIPEVFKDPEPEVGIEKYDSHQIVILVRPFVKPDDYWQATFDCYQKIKQAFNQHGIQVAYSEGVQMGPIGE